MLIDAYRLAGPSLPSELGFVEQEETDGPLNFGAHQANDLIVMFLRATGSTTPPSTPATWTSLLASSTSFGGGWRIVWKIDTTNTETSYSMVGLQGWALLLRNAAIGASDTEIEVVGTSSDLPDLTLTDPGNSTVYAGMSSNQTYAASTPAGLNLIGDNALPALGGGFSALWATDPEAETFSGYSTTWSNGAYVQTFAFEIVPG